MQPQREHEDVMRILMKIQLACETFNAAVRDGSAGPKTDKILEQIKPEAVYFTEMDGKRTVIVIIELENPSMVPAMAEPWFLTFNAEVEFHVVMSHQDLQKADFNSICEKWS